MFIQEVFRLRSRTRDIPQSDFRQQGAKYLIVPGALEEIVRAAIARNAALSLGAAGWVERAERFLVRVRDSP
jgi:hypothetical protein